jgi:hypothetical protein
MKHLIALGAALVALSACNLANPPDATPAAATGDTETAEAAAAAAPTGSSTVQVSGMSFPVDVSADRSFAIVGTPSSSGSYTGGDVEAAAQSASGCSGAIVAGDWAMLGDLSSFDLSNLRPNETDPFPGWRVTLSC